MTTATEVSSAAQLLYLSVDLGDRPPFTAFREQVDTLDVLQQHCILLSLWDIAPKGAEAAWLATIAESIAGTVIGGKVVGPAIGGVIGQAVALWAQRDPSNRKQRKRFQEKLDLVGPLSLTVVRTSISSPWVTVLGTMAQTYAPVGYGLATLFALQRLMKMRIEWQTHRSDMKDKDFARARMSEVEARQIIDQHAESVTRIGFPTDSFAEAAEAFSKLGPVDAAEMINHNDPRATGTA